MVPTIPIDEEDAEPPEEPGDEDEDGPSYWFVGALWSGTEDQLPRFLHEGIWQNGYDDQLLDVVRRMKPGDRIAIKASFVQRLRLPFDVGGKSVSGMRIKATGTVLENINDGRTVKVEWDPPIEPARLVLLHLSDDHHRSRHGERECMSSDRLHVPGCAPGLCLVPGATLLDRKIWRTTCACRVCASRGTHRECCGKYRGGRGGTIVHR